MSGSASRGFAITITAQDLASKQIDQINRRLAAMRAPAERLQKSFAKLADNTGVTALASGMRKVADASFSAFENLSRAIAPLGVLTGAASIAGLARLASTWAEAGSQLRFAGQRARISVTDLAALEGATRLAGGSAEAMGAGVRELNDNLFKAAQGTSPDAILGFNKLGISWKNADGSLRKVADVMPEVIDKLSKIQDPTYRAQIATLLLGGAVEGLSPLLRLSGRELQAYIQQAKYYGTMTDAGAAKSWALQEAQLRLAESTKGLWLAIGDSLEPVMRPLLDSLSTWIASNRTILGQDVAGFVNKAVPQVQAFATASNEVAKALGGWQTILETLGVVIAGGWALRMVAGLSPLTVALAAIAVTIAKVQSFEERTAPANLPVGSPFWKDIPEEEQSNYPNSPRSQAFLHPNGGNPNGFSWLNPGSWLGHGANQQAGSFPSKGVNNPADEGWLHDYFRKKGYSEIATAGILANYQGESGMNAGAVGDMGASAGLGQWRDGRRLEFQAKYGHDVSLGTPAEQAEFTDWELNHTEKAAGDALRRAKSAREAGEIVSTQYERPQDVGMNAALRGQYAEQIHSKFANIAAPAPAANIANGSGAPPAPAQGGTTTVKGSADLKVRIEAADGLTARTTATTSGDLFNGAPRIDQAMAW